MNPILATTLITVAVVWPQAPNDTNLICSVTYNDVVSNAVIVITSTNVGIADSFPDGISRPRLLNTWGNADTYPAGYYHLKVTTSGNAPTPPAAPTNLHVNNATTNSITLGWTLSTATNIQSQTLAVWAPTWSNYITLAPASHSHQVNGLTHGTTYKFAVSATDSNNLTSPYTPTLTYTLPTSAAL